MLMRSYDKVQMIMKRILVLHVSAGERAVLKGIDDSFT
jgi:hypothetical protein